MYHRHRQWEARYKDRNGEKIDDGKSLSLCTYLYSKRITTLNLQNNYIKYYKDPSLEERSSSFKGVGEEVPKKNIQGK